MLRRLVVPSFLLKEALVDRHTYYFGWNNGGPVGEPIQECSRHVLIPTHYPAPLRKAQIGRHNDGDAFIESGAELKEQLCSSGRKRNEAQFVQHEYLVLTDVAHQLGGQIS